MRIAIVVDSLNRGGAERQALLAVQGLTDLGCDAELVHYYPRGGSNTSYEVADAIAGRIRYIPLAAGRLRFLARLAAYARSRRLEVVHGFKSAPTLYAAVAGRLAGVPAIVGGCRAEYEDGAFIRTIHRMLRPSIQGWVVNSRAVADSVVAAVGARRQDCFVVSNGLDPKAWCSTLTREEARSRLGLPASCDVVSIVARLRPQKNLDLFLEAARQVGEIRPGARFLIVGDGEESDRLLVQARALGLEGRVQFLGLRSDIPEILAATDISVLTSHYEGMANALLEAMSAGIPVVTTDFAGARELVSDGQQGLIAPLGDAAGLSTAILRLLADPDLRARMGREGQRTVEQRFGVATMARQLLAAYRSCLAGRDASDH